MNINELVIKWQATKLNIELGNCTAKEARNQLEKIIDEIFEHRDQIISEELSIANKILLFTNITLYSKRYNVDVAPLIILGLGQL